MFNLCIDGIGSYDQASFILPRKVISYPHVHRDMDAAFIHTCIIERPSCLHVLLSYNEFHSILNEIHYLPSRNLLFCGY